MNKSVDLGLLLLRLALGGIMIAHGVAKVLPESGGPQGFAGYLADKTGIEQSLALAWFTIVAEIGGGAMVVLGVLPRIGALLIAVVMAGAIWAVHWENGFFLAATADANGEVANGYEYNVALLGMALAIICAGGGAFSLLRSKRK